ncbi:MAG: hypothetical protein MUC49_16830 [Raineya sp.]|jgi:hypothetical protein|nr:hypothetical protein [Raineya sp.]
MEKFTLQIFLTLSGFSAASGLVYHKDNLFVIADNSGFLYQYKLKTNLLTHHPLITNPQHFTPKQDKLDLEAITRKGNALHIFSSGSKKNRCQKFIFNLNSKETQNTDLTNLYEKIIKETKISEEELNLEGALYYRKSLFLFQRGNGQKAKNGIIKVTPSEKISFIQIDLLKINNVSASFTDAILVEDKIYFLASAEDSQSTYLDGKVLGSIFGILNTKTFEIEKTIQITTHQKFEGLTFYKKENDKMQFLLCEDNDTEQLETTIYKLEI